MFSTKNFTTFIALFLAIFAFYAVASPILGSGAAVVGDELVRRGSCSSSGCNEGALLAALLDLKTKIDIKVALLNGHNDPVAICLDIAAYIKASIVVILAIDVNVSGSFGSSIGDIVSCLCAILSSIISGCGQYNLLVIVLKLVVILDAVLADLIHACCTCCPGLLTLITKAVLGVTWDLLGFLNTFLACGLGL